MTKKSPKGAKTRQLSIRLTDDDYELVRKKADAEKRSMAYVIEEIIHETLGRTASKAKEQP